MHHTSGWVKLYRRLLEDEIFEDATLCGVFLRLLIMANRQPSKAKFMGEVITVQPGQILTGLREIAPKTCVSVTRRKLSELEKIETISQQISKQGRLITIGNWKKYQAKENEEKTEGKPEENEEKTPATLNGELKKLRSKEEKRVDTPPRADPSPVKQLAHLWNELSGCQLPKVDVEMLRSTSRRYRFAQSRLREKPDFTYWRSVIERIASSSFCRGDNDRGWKANFEFLVRSDSHIKVMEGNYDDKSNAPVQRNWEAILR